MKNKAQNEILRNANNAASITELYLLCESERQQVNVVMAKLLSNHTLRFARMPSNSYSHAA